MKRKYRIFAVLLLAALILTGGLSVTAHAETPQTVPEDTPTDDSGVKVDPQPLTPEGNMTLVDDIQGDAAKDKQFIVVQSKGGAYFYIMRKRFLPGHVECDPTCKTQSVVIFCSENR